MSRIVKTTTALTALLTLATPGTAQIGSQIDKSKIATQFRLKIAPDAKIVRAMPSAVVGKGCDFFENSNGQGQRWHKSVAWYAGGPPNQPNYGENVMWVGDYWNNKISSLRCDETQNVKCNVALYRDANRQSGEAILWSSQGLVNLNNYEGGWDNSVSSYSIICVYIK